MAFLTHRSPGNKTFIDNGIIKSHGLDCILTETWLDETGGKELIEVSPPNFFIVTLF